MATAIIQTLASKKNKNTLVRAKDFSVQTVVDKYIELSK
ncbi:hypothetical protein JCM19236_5050 [Vibrio sp. JCM 19236]|nr:hypothetical protein JCM19236_5050 [Vibrio sp. JCM 19236]